MPNLGNGTNCIKILLFKASKNVREPLVLMFFPIHGAHISNFEFAFQDLIGRFFVAIWPFHSQKKTLSLTEKDRFT